MTPLLPSEIAQYIAFVTGIPLEEAKLYTQTTLRCLKENLEIGRDITLPGLIKLHYKVIPGFTTWDGQKKHYIPEHLKLSVTASPGMAKKIAAVPLAAHSTLDEEVEQSAQSLAEQEHQHGENSGLDTSAAQAAIGRASHADDLHNGTIHASPSTSFNDIEQCKPTPNSISTSASAAFPMPPASSAGPPLSSKAPPSA